VLLSEVSHAVHDMSIKVSRKICNGWVDVSRGPC
jgi:hypothetical protein